MRLMVDCHVFDGEFQGSRTYLDQLYQHLPIDNEEVELFIAANDKSSIEHLIIKDKVSFVKIPKVNSIIRLLFVFPYLILKHKIDWAHFSYIVPPFKFCKYIDTVHDILFLSDPKYFSSSYRILKTVLYYISYKLSDIVLASSQYSNDQIIRFFGSHKGLVCLPIGMNDIDAMPVEFKKGRNYLLCVNRFEPRKNQLGLLKIFNAKNLWEDYDLVYVGVRTLNYSEFDDYLSSLSEEVKGSIQFKENLDNETLLGLIDNAELLVYPSFAEGFGLPPLEASIRGVKVVCSKLTSLSDFDFYQKYHFDPRDQNQFSEVVSYALERTNQEFEEDLKYIQNKIATKFNWKEYCKKLIKLMQ